MSTDSVPETPKVEKEPSFSDAFEFNNLFRIKGVKGLHVQASAIQKNGLVGMKSFVGAVSCTANKKDLECLGHFGVKLLEKRALDDKDVIGIAEVMDNLHALPIEEVRRFYDPSVAMPVGPFLEAMVPGYDPAEFKEYHAKKVLGWYNELVDAVSDMENTKIEGTPDIKVASSENSSND